MALSGSDTASQLTSHDLEALVNIQAELDRIGGTDVPEIIKDDELSTFNLDAEEVATTEAGPNNDTAQSNSSFRVLNSDMCVNVENVVVESQTSPSTTPTPELVADEAPAKSDVNNLTESAISLPKDSLSSVSIKTLKPIYIVPSRPGSMTLTSVAANDDSINRLIFTNASPAVSSIVGSGVVKPVIAPKIALDAKSVMKTQVIGAAANSSKTTVSTPVITKVIFTSNPVTGHSSTQTVSLAPGTSLAAAMASNTLITSLSQLSQPLKIVTASHAHGINTSGKTVTLTPSSTFGSPVKPQIITTLPGTPTKQTIMVSKIALSPKTPTKITMIPVSVAKSPQKIAPAPSSSGAQFLSKAGILTALTGTSTTTMTTTSPKVDTIAVSPSNKFIIKQPISQTMTVKQGTLASFGSGSTINNSGTQIKHISVATSSGVQPIQVPGSKFSYIRLVSSSPSVTAAVGSSKPPAIAPVVAARPIAPASIGSTIPTTQPQQIQVSSSSQVKIAVPIAPATSGQLIGQPMVASKHLTGQRILIPASNVTNIAQMRPTSSGIAVPANALTQLPPGTTLFSPSGNIVMVPAQYVTQIQPQATQGQSTTATRTSSTVTSSNQQAILPAQVVSQQSSAPAVSSSSSSLSSSSQERVNCAQLPSSTSSSKHQLNGSTLEPNGVRPRKPCNCTKSQCLKLYCDCFANGEFCHNCNCNNCYNNLEHEEERQKAIKACLERNPQAFHPKIGKGRDGDIERRHNKGCNCKRSGCLKNYCECYEAKIMCSYMCKCVGCKNFAESAEKKTLMHLADAAEVRVQQQTAAKSKLSSQMQDIPSKPVGSSTGERLPSSFITTEVVEATCQCLLAQVEAGQEKGQSDAVVEQLVLQEFGRCLLQIIEYASRTKV